ncbi:MAG: hypothetical protein DRR03_01490 [Gammaproteobacteria bacterium]|nr:MAG: hypothetical protein DRR03_01490 [Gammaproteobacteria bacterium]
MKKLLTIAVLGLSLSGFAFADDAGDFSDVKSTMGQPYDGQTLGRAGYPEPAPTTSGKGVVIIDSDRAGLPS